jgi:hypothetical protein
VERKSKLESNKIAGKEYEVEDYKSQDEVSSGLATTHEQASDGYMEGTIDSNPEDNAENSTQ